MSNLVTVASYLIANRAHIAQAKLEENGISSMITDEVTAQVLGTTIGVGGVRVMVNEEDEEKARAIIETLSFE